MTGPPWPTAEGKRLDLDAIQKEATNAIQQLVEERAKHEEEDKLATDIDESKLITSAVELADCAEVLRP